MFQSIIPYQPEQPQTQSIQIAELQSEIENLKASQLNKDPEPTGHGKTPFWIRSFLYFAAFGLFFPLGILLMVMDKEYRWKHFFISCLVFFGLPIVAMLIFVIVRGPIGQTNNRATATVPAPTSAPAPTQAPPPNQQLYTLAEGYGFSIVSAKGAIFDSPGGNVMTHLNADLVVTWKAMKGDCQWFLAGNNSEFKPGTINFFYILPKEIWIHRRDIEGFYPTALSALQALDWGLSRFIMSPTDRAKTTC